MVWDRRIIILGGFFLLRVPLPFLPQLQMLSWQHFWWQEIRYISFPLFNVNLCYCSPPRNPSNAVFNIANNILNGLRLDVAKMRDFISAYNECETVSMMS
jgi:hypothetical protein